ncbi:hypothetical protein CDD82_6076 [Ophiocordyceps australis]|uniref:Uncharacterized protein n=1 Tax=Ophiocordyceps australis TaxID=1399860 RepID=A0A2C5ZUW0_9HYPO|nr:hypothetical protein CDD82_6076 [Ophiocordyceps australis]
MTTTSSNDPKAADADIRPAASEAANKASSSSDSADKDAGGEMSVSYGTRSRNRAGNARPNYAEDKDIEMDDYDFYREKSSTHDSASKKPSRQSSATANGDGPVRGASGARKPCTDESKSQSSCQDQSLSGAGSVTNTWQLSGAMQPSRKRKATSTAATATTATATATTTTASGEAPAAPAAGVMAAAAAASTAPASAAAATSTRRGANGVQTQASAPRETNMMTFEKCGSRPENGRMKADDGTVLEPNGESSSTLPLMLWLAGTFALRTRPSHTPPHP